MRKPPKNHRCDASTGVDYSAGQPRIKMCPNLATQTIPASSRVMFDIYVCDDCAPDLRKKYEST